jgi:photosystem II stability/assembly factor-like uncharacterized protein
MRHPLGRKRFYNKVILLKYLYIIVMMCLFIPLRILSQNILSNSIGTSRLYCVSFADTANGWIAGDTILLHTTNGGGTWSKINNLSGYFYSVCTPSSNVAWTCLWSESGNLLERTIDNGATWTTILRLCTGCISNIGFNNVKCRDSLQIWITEYAGSPLADWISIYKSTDAGKTWTYYLPSHGSPFSFTDLSLGPDSSVATLFARKIFYRSLDDGKHWISDTLSRRCNGILITGHYQYWAVGDSGVVYHSPSFGVPFSLQATALTENLTGIVAVDSQTLWAIGTNGLIIRTTNYGSSWQRISSPTKATLNGIFFSNSNNGWIVGDSGIVFQIRDGVITSVSNQIINPHKFNLFQNYPNPFNPSTKISFSLPSRSYVSLKIFDLLGREVATLVDQELLAGNYTRIWDAANMTSGIYFSRFQISSSVITKKLILIK